MKETYNEAKIEILTLKLSDVLLASPGDNILEGDEDGDN